MTITELRNRIASYQERVGHTLRVRAALFDMDGVLYDSMPAHERSWLETAQHFGLSMCATDVYMWEGQTSRATINCLYDRTHHRPATDDEVRRIYEHKTALFGTYNDGSTIPHIYDVLQATRGLRRIIVTGSSQPSLLDRVQVRFPDTFAPEDLITGQDVRYGKPHPEPYLIGIERAEVAPYEAIVIENAPRGVRSGHDAGCFTIAVNTGPLEEQVLYDEGADLVLPNMQTLALLLPELLRH